MLFSSTAYAQSASVFNALAGSWTGSGTLTHQSGMTERIRCQATYAPADDTLRQRLSCHSDSTSFNLESSIAANGGRFQGDWVETNRDARGKITGVVRPNLIQGQVRGPSFTASLVIALRGRRQTVVIRTRGADITALSMDLARAR